MLQLGIFVSACVFFLAGVGGIALPFLKRKMENIPFVSLSWIIALFLLFTVFASQAVSVFLTPLEIPTNFQVVFLLTVLGVFAMPLFYRRDLKWQVLCILCLCFAGTFALPLQIENIWILQSVRLLSAVLWTFYILLYIELDRVPLEGYVLNIIQFLMILMMSMPVFALLPESIFSGCLLILVLVLLILLLFRRNNFLWLGFPLVFVLTYLSGYIINCLAFSPYGGYIVLALAYPLMECVVTVGWNLYRYHRIFPIEVPFLSERALQQGTPAKKVFKTIFYTSVLTACIAIISIRGQSHQLWAGAVFMTVVVLYNLYIGLFQVMTKVSLKNVGKDAKEGWRTFVNEMKSVSLRNLKNKVSDERKNTFSQTGSHSNTEKTSKKKNRYKEITRSK